MFGSILSSVVKVATLPLDVANAGLDVLGGGDGSKESRREIPIVGDAEELRDALSEMLKECDE